MIRVFIFLIATVLTSNIYTLILPIREIAKVSSLKENQLIGYGLVVGLPQTGDSKSSLAKSTLKKLLKYRGMDVPDKDLKSKNIAAVMVMTKIPAYGRIGSKLDIWVSSIGDAKSLLNGYLLQTPLYGGDNQIYAVAQSSIANSRQLEKSYIDRYGRQKRRRVRAHNVSTVHIPDGAIIEKQINQSLVFENATTNQKHIEFSLSNFDLVTAQKVIHAINQKFANSASLEPSGTIKAQLPAAMNALDFISDIYKLEVDIKTRARVVIDPRSATIVMGENVGISGISITQNGLNIRVTNNSEPVLLQTWDEPNGSSFTLNESPNVSQLVEMLNKMGMQAEDIIDILKAIHAAGALHAELIVL